MNKILLILGVIVVMGAAAGGYFYFKTSENSLANNNQENTSITGSFKDLVESGKAWKCNFDYDDGETVSNGTMYVTEKGEKIKGDINITASAAGPMDLHIIRNERFNYIWGAGFGGFKSPVTNDEVLFEGDGAAIDENNLSFSCDRWEVDEQVFAVPTDVDFDETLPSMSNASGEGIDLSQQDPCSLCAMVAGDEASAECRQTFQCGD